MARLLVWAQNSRTGEYTAGDVISVCPDTHVFSPYEDPAEWVASGNHIKDFPGHTRVIDLPDCSLSKAKQLLEPRVRPALITEPEFTAPDEEDRYVNLAHRKWRVNPAVNAINIKKKDLDSFIENRDDDGAFMSVAPRASRG